MTTIGQAFLRVVADTSSMRDDVEEGSRRSGEGSGVAFSEGFGSKIKSIGETLTGGLAGAGALAAGAFASAWSQSTSASDFEGKLGIAPADAAKLAKTSGKVYADNWGESIGEVNDAVATIKQSLGNAVPDDALQGLTEKALAFNQTFGTETPEVIRAVSQMLRTKLASSADEAFDILTKGEQNGADKAGDLMDSFNEYGTQFRKLGLDGSTALGLINQGIANGARDSDLVSDSLKEFSIRALDGSQTTIAGFQALGLNAQQMSEKISRGGVSAKEGLGQTLNALRAIQDPVKRSQIAVSLFGTQAEDLGDALYSLNPATATAGKGMDGLTGASDKMRDAASATSNPIQNLTRSIMGTVTSLAGHLVPIMGPAASLISRMGPLILGLVGGYIALSATTKAYAAVEGVMNVLRGTATAETGLQTGALIAQRVATVAASIATRAWTIVQAAFNAVMIDNPIGVVVIAIAALVAGVIYAYNHFDWFRQAVATAWSYIKTAVSVAWTIIKTIFGYIAAGVRVLVAIWVTEFKVARTIVSAAFGAIKAVVLAVVGAVRAYISVSLAAIRAVITGVMTAIRTTWSAAWGAIRATVSAVWGGIKSIVSGAINGVLSVIRGVGSTISSAWSAIWNGLKSTVTSVVRGIASIVSGIWDGVTAGLRSVLNGGITIINGAIGFINDKLIDTANEVPFVDIPHIPKIPYLAKGALTTGPMLAVVGDNPSGQEAVLPMDDPNTVGLFAAAFDKADQQRPASQKAAAAGGTDTRIVALLEQLLVAVKQVGGDVGGALDDFASIADANGRTQPKGAWA